MKLKELLGPRLEEAAAIRVFSGHLSKTLGYPSSAIKTEYSLAPSAHVDLVVVDSDDVPRAILEFKRGSGTERKNYALESLQRYIHALPNSSARVFSVHYQDSSDVAGMVIQEYLPTPDGLKSTTLTQFPKWGDLFSAEIVVAGNQNDAGWAGPLATERFRLSRTVDSANRDLATIISRKKSLSSGDRTSALIGEVHSQLRLRFTDLGVPQPWATNEELFQSVSVFEAYLRLELQKTIGSRPETLPLDVRTVLEKLQKELLEILQSEKVEQLFSAQAFNRNEPTEDAARQRIDILVIVAMQDPELNELLKVIDAPKHIKPFSNSSHAVCWQGTLSGSNATVVAATQNDMGMANAAVLTTKLIIHLRPKYVVMTGIAAGMNEKTQQVGDVLVATHTYDLALGKREREEDFAVFKPKMYQKDVRDHFQHHGEVLASTRDSDFKNAIEETAKAVIDTRVCKRIIRKPFSVHPGPFGSGGTVIADQKEVETYKNGNAALIGFDMEAHAVATAVAECGLDERPQVLIAKAICDFAGGDKSKDKDAKQRLAARASAEYFRLFFLNYVFGIDEAATPAASAG